MSYVIRALGFAADDVPCPFAGQYAVSFNPDAHDGIGYGEWTNDLAKAKRFAGHQEAFEFWRKPSRIRPRRPDGKPNRPMTCVSVEILPEEAADD